MRLLLDTHFAIWLVTEPERMPMAARDLIVDPANDVWGSVVSIWEVAIKHARREPDRLDGLMSGVALLDLLTEAGLPLLPVSARHAAGLDALPPVHKDPFDRMLVSQARAEPLRLLTVDRTLAGYGDAVLIV